MARVATIVCRQGLTVNTDTETLTSATLVDDEITVEITPAGVTDDLVDDTAMNLADNTLAFSTEHTDVGATSSTTEKNEATRGGGAFGTYLLLIVIFVWRRAPSLKFKKPGL